MAALTSAAVRVAATFYPDERPLDTGGRVGITVALLTVTLLSNVCGVKVWNLYVANSGNLLTFFSFTEILNELLRYSRYSWFCSFLFS
jgi:hypothetical protein